MINGMHIKTPSGINARLTVAEESWAAQYVQPKATLIFIPTPNR